MENLGQTSGGRRRAPRPSEQVSQVQLALYDGNEASWFSDRLARSSGIAQILRLNLGIAQPGHSQGIVPYCPSILECFEKTVPIVARYTLILPAAPRGAKGQ